MRVTINYMREFKNAESEQITLDGELVYEHDARLTRKETKTIYSSIFGDMYSQLEICGKKVDTVVSSNKKIVLLTSQISYLGNPHPTYKKRVQLKEWFKDVYELLGSDSNVDIRLIGIYRYKELVIFVDFDKEPYFSRKMHNSSAHVYTNDLYQAFVHGIFSKRDAKNNLITTIKKNYFKAYLLGEASLTENLEQEIIDAVDDFNRYERLFGNWICSDVAIRQMRDNDFPKWKEAEWAGFFVEFMYDNFIRRNGIKDTIEYINNKTDENRMLDFDLFFSKANFYGDLKSSNVESKETMLNDKGNIVHELNNFKKLWYIIYEHETIKDRDIEGHPYTRKRLELIREIQPDYKLGQDDSYLQRMKAKVKYTKMFIVEVNQINYASLLEEMSSNFHNPDGNIREPKLCLTKENIKNAIIYSYVA